MYFCHWFKKDLNAQKLSNGGGEDRCDFQAKREEVGDEFRHPRDVRSHGRNRMGT